MEGAATEKQKVRELKRYTRDLLRDHELLEQKLKTAEGEVTRLQEAEAELRASAEGGYSSNSALFEELVFTRERAQQAEVSAARLKTMLAMAFELRGVDVARTRASAAIDLEAALESLRKRAKGEVVGSTRRIENDSSDECEALVVAVERAADECRRTWRRRRKVLRNGDGVSRRLVKALEDLLSHRVVDVSYEALLFESASACAVASEWRAKDDEDDDFSKETTKRLEERVLLCVAKATEARNPQWLESIGWGRGRMLLLELLNRNVFGFALEALCIEHRRKSAGPAVAHYAHGATLLDLHRASRVVRALDKLASSQMLQQRQPVFSLAHPIGRATIFQRDEVGDGTTFCPPPSALAALRRRGAKSAVSCALDGQPWRKARVEPRRSLGSLLRTNSVDRRVRLRDGPEDHVVCWQWQSQSDRLRWSVVHQDPRLDEDEDNGGAEESKSFDADDDAGDETDDEGDEGKRTRRWGGDLAQPEDLDDLEDDVVVDDTATVYSTPPRDLTSSRRRRMRKRHDEIFEPISVKVPDVIQASECVVGAEKGLGPVHECWALVPAWARVKLRCELVAKRPLVRARTARFRVVAIRASTFFEESLVEAAKTAEQAAWAVAEETRDQPPADAADFAAKLQLDAPAARVLFRDLQRSIQLRSMHKISGPLCFPDDDDDPVIRASGGDCRGSANDAFIF